MPAEGSEPAIAAARSNDPPAELWLRQADAEGMSWSLIDPADGVAVSIESSPEFVATLLFAPPGRGVLSPVVSTCLPFAFNLHEVGQPSGARALAPGETWRGWTRLRVASL